MVGRATSARRTTGAILTGVDVEVGRINYFGHYRLSANLCDSSTKKLLIQNDDFVNINLVIVSECGCNRQGSKSMQCDRDTGKCECIKGKATFVSLLMFQCIIFRCWFISYRVVRCDGLFEL